MRLEGKVAAITGAGSGIGRASAILFAKEGAKVVVVCRTPSTGQETVQNIKNDGFEAIFIPADVSKSQDVKEIIAGAVNKYGRLDILFNNAGVNAVAPITEIEEDEWDKIINTNLKGVFLGCKHAIPIMKKQGGGVIINTASTFAYVGKPKMGPYCASKGGIVALTRAIALEVASYNIRVNCIVAGATLTPMVERSLMASGKPDETRKDYINRHPIGRLGKPEDIANAALYLASGDSSFVTGSSLFVDGGYTAQ
jgi:NAD(P)-dependent dehydrogenase (short-subunit alcohol dehydrogenase family)